MPNRRSNDLVESKSRQCLLNLAGRFAEFPHVIAVVLAGSRGAGTSDPESDFDVYVYASAEVPVEFRRALLGGQAEIDNRFWEPGDESSDLSAGLKLDIMYRSPKGIEDLLDRVLMRHEASIGFTTCVWFNILHSEPLFDREGWFEQLQQRADVAYPDELRRAVIAKNWPILRRNQSSYRRQIELALQGGDARRLRFEPRPCWPACSMCGSPSSESPIPARSASLVICRSRGHDGCAPCSTLQRKPCSRRSTTFSIHSMPGSQKKANHGPTASHCHTLALRPARGRAGFAHGTTSRFADTWRLTAGRARWPGSWTGRPSSAALQFYKSRSARLGEKRRCTAPRERRETRGVPLRIFRRSRLPCRGTSKSLASLRTFCCQAGGKRQAAPTLSRETFSSPSSSTLHRYLGEGRILSRAPRGVTACLTCRSAI